MSAKWMAANREIETPLVRRIFELASVEDAVIQICGLGFFELFINGARVGEEYFKPVWTDYGRRDLSNLLYPMPNRFGHRRYFLEYNVKDFLKIGQNVISVLLGNGWYRQNKRNVEGDLWYDDRLKLWFDLTYMSDGETHHICSDENLLHTHSHILFSNIYFGEIQDCAKRFEPTTETAGFLPMQEVQEKDFVFERQFCPSDVVVRTILPREITSGDVRIFDAGENITGWAVLRGAEGRVRVSYAEEINEDGTLNFLSAGGEEQISRDEYLNATPECILRPMFHWNAFRYFMIEGRVGEVSCEVVHANAPVLSEFESDDNRLNWLYDTFLRTMKNNLHCGVPSDCPHRERLGYTGDGWLTAQCSMMFLNVRDFYRKWIYDIFDCQDPLTGHVRHTAPFYGGGGGPGGWGGAIVWMSYFYYVAYRDKQFLKQAMPHVHRYLDCMETFSEGGLVVREIEGGWCLGDWCTPGEVLLPEPFVNTFFYLRLMQLADEMAGILGEPPRYGERIAAGIRTWSEIYYDPEKRTFCGGVQGADAFAAELGLVEQISFEKTAVYYAGKKCFDTGIFGTYFLVKQLFLRGYADVAFDLLTSEENPSFGWMRQRNATTFWESWDGGVSHDHPMFGGCVYYLIQAILGVNYDNPSSERLVIQPKLLHRLKHFRGSVHTPFGKVSIKFSQGKLEVSLPEHAKADLILDGREISIAEGHSVFSLPEFVGKD